MLRITAAQRKRLTFGVGVHVKRLARWVKIADMATT